jgi:hypothetical protein
VQALLFGASFDEDAASLPVVRREVMLPSHCNCHRHRFTVINVSRKLYEEILFVGAVQIALHERTRFEHLRRIDCDTHFIVAFIAKEKRFPFNLGTDEN